MGSFPIEFIASIFGFIATYLYVRENPWSWPLGLVMVLLYMLVFYNVKLYASFASMTVFAFIQLYGWWQWLYGGKGKSTLTISHFPKKEIWKLATIIMLVGVSAGYLLQHYTKAEYAYWDAILMIASFVAQWMLAKKYYQNWILWFVIDALYIGLYYHMQLYVTVLLYAAFLGLAVLGMIQWARNLRENKRLSVAT